jgi:hypothetical protein
MRVPLLHVARRRKSPRNRLLRTTNDSGSGSEWRLTGDRCSDQKNFAAAGYKVAANYAGNDAVAAKFKEETGIPVYKWDVSSYKDCGEGLKKVSEDLGPIDTRDQ